MDAEAFNYYDKAEKRLNETGCFVICSSKSQRYEDAADLYEKAAELYVRAKDWSKAGQCYENIADCRRQLGENTTSSYEKACYYFSQVPGSVSKYFD